MKNYSRKTYDLIIFLVFKIFIILTFLIVLKKIYRALGFYVFLKYRENMFRDKRGVAWRVEKPPDDGLEQEQAGPLSHHP